jgi:putative peptidoglycan lipid II flippase
VIPPPAASSSPALARSAGVTGAATLTSRILGLVRDQVLAALFGAGIEMDAFIVAFRIPNVVRDLFAEGAMSAAFVPTFTKRLTLRGKTEAWRLGNNLINALILTTGILVTIGMIFAAPIVGLYARDFGLVPGKLELTIALTRVMLPFLVTAAVAAAVMGMLNSLHHYFIPSLSPALFNVATILAAFTLAPLMPALGLPRIAAIAIAALVGGVLQVLTQWPSLRREGFRYRVTLDLRDPALRQVLILMGPGTVGLAATQVNLFVNTFLATSQGTGAVSWLSYAFRLMYLPIGLFGVSIATATLPAVSRHAAVGDREGIRHTVAQAIAMMLVLNVPAMFGLLALSEPIVRLLFERGRFHASDTAATAAALRFYAIGLTGYATARIASPVFYALGRSRVPVFVSVVTIALNVSLNVWLVRVLGFRGLALGTSIAMMVNGATLLVLLHRHLDGLDTSRLTATFLKVAVASGAMAAAAAGLDRVFSEITTGGGVVMNAARVFASIAVGIAVLTAVARLLRIREFDEALSSVTARLKQM